MASNISHLQSLSTGFNRKINFPNLQRKHEQDCRHHHHQLLVVHLQQQQHEVHPQPPVVRFDVQRRPQTAHRLHNYNGFPVIFVIARSTCQRSWRV